MLICRRVDMKITDFNDFGEWMICEMVATSDIFNDADFKKDWDERMSGKKGFYFDVLLNGHKLNYNTKNLSELFQRIQEHIDRKIGEGIKERFENILSFDDIQNKIIEIEEIDDEYIEKRKKLIDKLLNNIGEQINEE
jgi:hypothetical protein